MSLQRATLLAAVATALQALIYFISYVVPLFSLPGPLPLNVKLLIPASMLQLALWPAFFFSLYREYSGVPRQLPSRRIALLLAVILAVNYATGRIASNVIYRYWLTELQFWGMLAAWLAFLVTFGLGPELPRVRKIAIVLAVMVTLEGLYGSRSILSLWLRFLTPSHHSVSAAWQW
jgi:hypothetical protein